MGTRVLQTLPDPVPAAAIDEIGGGTRLLELQASCPVRAFCELRLAARPLERIRRGIHPRVRGIALHRALELLFRPVAGTGPFPVAGRREGIAEAAAAALSAAIPWTTPPWDLIAALEAARAGRALGALLDREAVRGSMEVAAVEVRTRLDFGRYALTGRIDRVDRLPSGGYVIIDYKTGQAPMAAAWMDERLTAPQLPAYAVTMPEAVAFVVAAIGDGRVDYRAVGDLPNDYPARPRPALAHGEWLRQVGRWRAQIEHLLDEFAAGDVRINPDSTALAAGDYAPLTRVHAAQEICSYATASGAND